jgi:hypothetical protein
MWDKGGEFPARTSGARSSSGDLDAQRSCRPQSHRDYIAKESPRNDKAVIAEILQSRHLGRVPVRGQNYPGN